MVPSVNNGVLCIGKTVGQTSLSRAKHEVTPGTLNGILASAEAALAARSDRDRCGLTVNKLAAFMLSVGFRETPFPSLRNVQPTPARSPMSLGRSDVVGVATGNERLYSDGLQFSQPRRAFFHAGVGWWQLDDLGATVWVQLNHAERADTGLGVDGVFAVGSEDSGGGVVAKIFAQSYCSGASNGLKKEALRSYQASQWAACGYWSYQDYLEKMKIWDMTPEEERQGQDPPVYVNGCMDMQFPKIYLDLGDADDLSVTITENEGQYSTSGGVDSRSCRWADGVSGEFDCFLYDTENPEGRMYSDNPDASTKGRSPLAAPFVAFTYGGSNAQRFAVFPGSVLSTLETRVGGTEGPFATRYKAGPKSQNIRKAPGSWSSTSYNLGTTDSPRLAVLEVAFCRDTEWVIAGSSRSCRWVSVNDDEFAKLVGVTGPVSPSVPL